MNNWYQESFGKDYLTVYKHRDLKGAYHEVKQMVDWLLLSKGAHILDLCCGMGRHAMALTEFGYKVTGVDLSEVLLSEAKKNDIGGSVEWLLSDMRKVQLERSFDAVVNLFTSFGYFENDQENERVLHEICRLLKPGGKYVIDFLNPGYVRNHFVPNSERQEQGLTICEARRIEDGFVRKQIIISQEGTPERNYSEQVKLYDKRLFLDMLKRADLLVDEVFGGYDGQLYDQEQSPRMIFLGHKEG